VAVPILGYVLRFVFFLPCWEIVQLVGLQTLDLAILVRVQVSQPNYSNGLRLSGFVSRLRAFNRLQSTLVVFY
jgi:hypothetical protein